MLVVSESAPTQAACSWRCDGFWHAFLSPLMGFSLRLRSSFFFSSVCSSLYCKEQLIDLWRCFALSAVVNFFPAFCLSGLPLSLSDLGSLGVASVYLLADARLAQPHSSSDNGLLHRPRPPAFWQFRCFFAPMYPVLSCCRILASLFFSVSRLVPRCVSFPLFVLQQRVWGFISLWSFRRDACISYIFLSRFLEVLLLFLSLFFLLSSLLFFFHLSSPVLRMSYLFMCFVSLPLPPVSPQEILRSDEIHVPLPTLPTPCPVPPLLHPRFFFFPSLPDEPIMLGPFLSRPPHHLAM